MCFEFTVYTVRKKKTSLNMALSREFCSVEENHDEQSNVGIKKQNLSLPLEYAKTKIQNVPKKSLGSGKEAMSLKGSLASPTPKGSVYMTPTTPARI